MIKSEIMKSCSYCGEPILEIAIKCKHCGEYLDRPRAPQPQIVHPPTPPPAPAPAPIIVEPKGEGCFLQTMNVGCMITAGIIVFALIMLGLSFFR
ncbi:MAG: hypothetical protein WC530_09460 [Candidatus Omnitrophota bacterium]|jgi:hypothetical protein